MNKKIWFTSDFHFGHNQPFIYEARGFNSIDEHNVEIVKRFNSVVSPEDEVYVLGDLMLNDNEKGIDMIKQLNGKLHIILGNHDSDIRKGLYMQLSNVVSISYGEPFKYKKINFFLSHYPTLTSNKEDDKKFRTRVFNICGHSHTQNKLADIEKGVYHVELDAHNCYPVLIDNIIEDLRMGFIYEKK